VKQDKDLGLNDEEKRKPCCYPCLTSNKSETSSSQRDVFIFKKLL